MTVTLTTPALLTLVSSVCPSCGGDGFHVTGDGYTEVACRACDSTGYHEICGDCGQVPTVVCGVEHCGCLTCEICERQGELDSANVCTKCRDEMAETIRREEDERAEPIDAEIKWALSVGLCRPEQVM